MEQGGFERAPTRKQPKKQHQKPPECPCGIRRYAVFVVFRWVSRGYSPKIIGMQVNTL